MSMSSEVESTARAPRRRERTVIVSGVASDSHTWNLVYLQLLVEELGFDVVNLGPCVPDELLESECRSLQPALVVISSVNGHGYQDGMRVVARLRASRDLRDVPIVIGGKLGIDGGTSGDRVTNLLAAGFDAVFDDREDSPASFRRFVTVLAPAPPAGRPAQLPREAAS